MRTSLKLAVAALCTAVLAGPIANATGTLAPVQVFEDGTLDSAFLAEATPEAQDLVAGSIGETDEALTFTWKVVDIMPEAEQALAAVSFYWEFQLDPHVQNLEPGAYSLSVTPNAPDAISNTTLSRNCTKTANLVQCETVEGANIAVDVDAEANTVTATVLRSDLKIEEVDFAVDGATLTDVELFDGIATVVGVGLYSTALADEAVMDEPYVLGSARA